MSDQEDPLVSPTTQGSCLSEPAQSPPTWFRDLNTSHPLGDLWVFLLRPRHFFRSADQLLAQGQSKSFFWGKVFFTFFFLQWISILSDLAHPESFHFEFDFQGDSEELTMLPFLADFFASKELSGLQERLRMLPLLFKQALVILTPFLELFAAVVFAKVSQWGLRIVAGWTAPNAFLRILFVAIVVRYFAVAGFLPFAGAFWAGLLSVVYFLIGLQEVTHLSKARVFFSSFVFSFVLSGLMFFVAGLLVLGVALLGGFIFSA